MLKSNIGMAWIAEQDYQRLIRKYPPLAALLHTTISVRRVGVTDTTPDAERQDGYTVAATFGTDGEVFATLPEAQEARRALIYRELLATEDGYLEA